MKNARPHRFPPLAQLIAGASAAAIGEPAAAVEAFHKGMDKGYEEGFRSGSERGREEGLADGREEGKRQGRDLGRQEVLERYARFEQPLDGALQALQQLQADYQAAMRKEVVDLVGKVARQVIRCELALQPLQLLTMVDETLATLPRVRDDEVEIFLHPEDLQRITDLNPARAARWKLVADAKLEPGECLVKAGSHEADAGCRQRQAAVMEQVSSQLLEAAPEAAP